MNGSHENILHFPQDNQASAPQPQLVKDPLTPTIFHEPWWLNIVAPDSYKLVEVQENGEAVGRLSYFLRNRFGMKYSIMPPMTHFLGPAVVEGEGSYSTRFLRRARIVRELIAKLPEASLYKYKCHRDITDTIAFQQEEFITGVQFTYEIPPQPEEELWKNMRTEKRKKIRQAQKLHTVTYIEDPLEFLRFYDVNFREKGVKNVCDEQLCASLIEACLTRKRGRIYAARNQEGELVAAVFCIWDATASFYYMSTRTQEAHSGAISLLAWEALKDASAQGLIFDFDGLNNPNAVLFFSEFGGTVSPRYIVTRQTLAGGLALSLKDWKRESRYFF